MTQFAIANGHELGRQCWCEPTLAEPAGRGVGKILATHADVDWPGGWGVWDDGRTVVVAPAVAEA